MFPTSSIGQSGSDYRGKNLFFSVKNQVPSINAGSSFELEVISGSGFLTEIAVRADIAGLGVEVLIDETTIFPLYAGTTTPTFPTVAAQGSAGFVASAGTTTFASFRTNAPIPFNTAIRVRIKNGTASAITTATVISQVAALYN